MKRTLLFIACVLASLTMSAQDELAVGDLQNSGCLSMARGEDYSEPVRTIVLTKEGSILSVQLLNYGSNCGTRDFNVTSDVSGDSKDSTPSVVISVVPVVQLDDEMDCYCPFNVSFTVRDLEPNRFYLDCWWYKGLVELTDGEPIVLEYKVEDVTIDGISYKLLKVMHKAMLMDWTTKAAELYIPSEVNYERETYIVTSISKDAFWHLDHATKMTVPKTVKSMDFDYDGAIYANPFRECKSLEWIDVEDGCPLFSSVDGVLFTKDKTMLLGYPIASSRKTYTVPEGVTNIRSGAFQYNKYLRKLVIPEEVTYLGWHLFSGTESLEELYIRGVIKPECMSDLFGGMDTKVAVYVQPSEIEKFQAVYQGPVYPLPEQTSDNMAYRPFIEDDKEWVVKVISNGWPTEEWIEYYYFDGDTIVNGQTAKR
ncbi:MAG: leucine-rich repeat protein, partial [Prevotella sp.]|nr:leucine-rich repeat protein [Prevotella sp.]